MLNNTCLDRISLRNTELRNKVANRIWSKFSLKIFLISLCITKRQYKCRKSRWKFSGNKTFFRLSNYFDPENVGMLCKLFFHCTRFFFFWFWCGEIFLRTLLWSQRCSYIPSNHLYHLLIRLKVQSCHG